MVGSDDQQRFADRPAHQRDLEDTALAPASQLLNTLVGSFGLVAAAALIASAVFVRPAQPEKRAAAASGSPVAEIRLK